MKTDDLITLMTQDAPVGMRYGRALAVALSAGVVFSAVLLVATVGLRHNMASVFETTRVLFKIVVTLVLAVFAARLAMRIGRPGAETRLPILLLAVPFTLVVVAVIAELVALPQVPGRRVSSAAMRSSACSSCPSCRSRPLPACSGP